jgi:hypothetical protein
MSKREKHFIVIVFVSGILIMWFGKNIQANDELELLYMLFFVVPVGVYIATDLERRKRGTRSD